MLQTEFSLLKKATSKNIENLQEVVNLQQNYTTSLCSHINSIYTKLAQLDRQIQTHCLYPYPQSDVVQINALEYDSDIDGQTELLTYIHQCHYILLILKKRHYMPRTSKKIQPQSPPIPENTPCFCRIPIGLNLSPNHFQIVQNIQYTRTLNNPGKNIQTTTGPNKKIFQNWKTMRRTGKKANLQTQI